MWARRCWRSSRAGARTSAATWTSGGCTRPEAPASPGRPPAPPRSRGRPTTSSRPGGSDKPDAVGGDLEVPRVPNRRGPAMLDEHRFAGVIALPAHGGAHRRDVVAAFSTAAADGATAADGRAAGCPVGPGWAARRGGATAPATKRGPGQSPCCARWVRGRSIPTITPSGWVPPEASMPTVRGGASPTRRSRSARGRGRGTWPTCRPTTWRIMVRTGREIAVARARLGWREPVTVERGLGR